MNVREYIDSGVLHDYAMGTLSDGEKAGVEQVCAQYPEIKEELQRLQETIEHYADKAAIAPPPAMQENIWNTLDNINKEKTGDINAKPVINKYSDHNTWKRIVAPFIPADTSAERIAIPIRHSDGVTQVLIISTTDVEDETHEHERESFLVLEGECECHIGEDIIRLGPGGFIEIPMYLHHNVKIISKSVTAVLQHVAV